MKGNENQIEEEEEEAWRCCYLARIQSRAVQKPTTAASANLFLLGVWSSVVGVLKQQASLERKRRTDGSGKKKLAKVRLDRN